MVRILLFVLLLCTTAQAIELQKDDIVPNRPPGYCFWTCIETLGIKNGIKELKGLTQARVDMKADRYKTKSGKWFVVQSHVGLYWLVDNHLKRLKVRYIHEYPGELNYSVFNFSHDKGVVFCVKAGWAGKDSSAHALICNAIDDEYVYYWDTNDSKEHKVTWDWISKWWSGEAVVLDP